MERYLVTHSLLGAWLYALKENPYEDATTEKDPMEDFMKVLRREPTEATEAMQNGIDFENLVTKIVYGNTDKNDNWYEAAYKVAEIVNGGVLQYKAYKDIVVSGIPVLLHGRLDCLKAGRIIDIKFTKSYEPGKYYDSTQHPMYFELIPEAQDFTYVASNGTGVWQETYRRDEARNIRRYISDFFDWLKAAGLWELYKEKWSAK